MTRDEILAFLDSNSWDGPRRVQLINLWNELRTDVPKIGTNSVRTPCRLRQVRDSLVRFVNEKVPA